MNRFSTCRQILIVIAAFVLSEPGYARGIPRGLVWEVNGNWRVNGQEADLKCGDTLLPGSLVSASGAFAQNLIVLLPDGQRLFLQCDGRPSCSRGFRLPALTQTIDDDTILTFQEVSAFRGGTAVSLHKDSAAGRMCFGTGRQQPNLLRVEALAILDVDNSVNIASAITSLPPGDYHLVVASGSLNAEEAIHWDGVEKMLKLSLGKTGLYDLRYYGPLNAERMREHLLVVRRAEFKEMNEQLVHWRETLTQWNERSPGWPIHDFLSLYLEALCAKNISACASLED
jgi:hypothetical protein